MPGRKPYLLLILTFIAISAWGSVGGSISGIVTDSTGAVVTKAQVTITNTDTGVSQTTTTNDREPIPSSHSRSVTTSSR